MDQSSNGASRAYGIAECKDIETLTGLEIMQALCSRHLPVPPISKTLGFDIVDVQYGAVVLEGFPSIDYYNPFGCVHGGWASSLLDSCMGYSIYSTLDVPSDSRTLELKVNFTRGIFKDTGPIRAEGHVLHRGARTATAEGRLLDAAGKLYAHGSTTCIIF